MTSRRHLNVRRGRTSSYLQLSCFYRNVIARQARDDEQTSSRRMERSHKYLFLVELFLYKCDFSGGSKRRAEVISTNGEITQIVIFG